MQTSAKHMPATAHILVSRVSLGDGTWAYDPARDSVRPGWKYKTAEDKVELKWLRKGGERVSISVCRATR